MKKTPAAVAEALAPFLEDEIITEVMSVVKSGKEATVYRCRLSESRGGGLAAAKVYRARSGRGFQNDAMYREDRVILNGRTRRAAEKKTKFGKEFLFSSWLNHEHATLQRLHAAGAAVPEALAASESALLLEWLGDDHHAAAPMVDVVLDRRDAVPIFRDLMDQIELILAENIVHGDLSAYNILFHQERAVIIDFPQATDPRLNRNGYDLLLRDIGNVCDHFATYGVVSDYRRITRGMWDRVLGVGFHL